MEETRAQVYLQLIETLLNCPNGEELQILEANLELVDSGFLQVCEVVAENRAEEGQKNHALRPVRLKLPILDSDAPHLPKKGYNSNQSFQRLRTSRISWRLLYINSAVC
ncbi:hypothetical protein [Microcoleus sp. POL10_C6]|uniref:hypothetical protein n=1 Tax=Microcoleus sp. POL10_C6 TaxID=2818852 RepID=UPI002FCFDDED